MMSRLLGTKWGFERIPVTIDCYDGNFPARCTLILGAFAEGASVEEAICDRLDVVKATLAYRDECGEK